jgi:hypothetical protein
MRRERRKNFRLEWNSPALICYDEVTRSCTLADLSNGGARIIVVPAETVPDEFTLRLPRGQGGIQQCRVLWRFGNTIGAAFDQKTDGGEPYVGSPAREPERTA